jgi:DNA-binding IclR family transcriptional regulator
VALAHSQVEELSKKLRETVDFSMVRNDHIVFLDQVMGAQRLRAVSAVGEAFPLHCCANGKAALALLDDAAILELIGEEYERRTGRTLWSWNTLRRDLETTRRRGYALDREEHTLGISAVGVALRDLFGNIVAVSVPVPTQRFLGNEKNIAKALLRVKRELASSISRDEEAESLTQHRRARANARV